MDKVVVGDIIMRYRLAGSGPPLVMIMGFTGSIESWGDGVIDALSRNFTLLLFDNRGAGHSTTGRRRFSIRRFADDTAGLMSALGIEKANVLGGSMGGMIAQELALNYPEMVDKLVLACTTCGGKQAVRPSAGSLVRLVLPYRSPEERVLKTVDLLFPENWAREHPEAVDLLIDQAATTIVRTKNVMRQAAAVATFGTYDRLPALDIPALVMCGAEDALIPPENSLILANRIPGAGLQIIEGGGHGFHMQYPERIGEALDEFL